MTHKSKHKCNFTTLYAPRGENEHAHQCLVCDDVILVGDTAKCDGNPKTHRRVS